MPVSRDGVEFSFARAVLWAAAWGVGAAVGVALGGWLTLVGAAGAPGTAGLDIVSDLVIVPLGAFVVVTGVHLAGQHIVAMLRGGPVKGGEQQNGGQRS